MIQIDHDMRRNIIKYLKCSLEAPWLHLSLNHHMKQGFRAGNIPKHATRHHLEVDNYESYFVDCLSHVVPCRVQTINSTVIISALTVYTVHFIIVAAGRGRCSEGEGGGDFALFSSSFAAAAAGKAVKVGSVFRLTPP